VPAVGTALLVRPMISGTVQGEVSGWHAGEVHAMLQGASFLIEVRHPAPPRTIGVPVKHRAVPPRRRAAPLYVPRRPVQVKGEAGMLEMRVEDQGTAWRPVQDNGGDHDGGDDGEDEPRRRVTGKAKASTAALAPIKKRANLNPFYHSSDESEAGHKERSDATM
jgi:hypothetical protein